MNWTRHAKYEHELLSKEVRKTYLLLLERLIFDIEHGDETAVLHYEELERIWKEARTHLE